MVDLSPDPSRPVRAPTMKDVAMRLGVSRQLVSLVLRDLPGPSTGSRQRILEAAQELGYRPHASARLLRQRRTRLIGLMFTMRNPFQVLVAERLFARAADEGFVVVFSPIIEERAVDEAVAKLLEDRVEAVVAFNPDPTSASLLAAADQVPVVWLGEWIDLDRVDNIHVDEVAGLDAVIEHLAGLDHQDIAYVGGRDSLVGESRAAAYRAAMRRHGLTDRAEEISSDFSEEGGATAARDLLRRTARPSAVVCCGDQTAAGLISVLARAGVHVPEDLSVVGFDDSYLASLSYLRLTTVRQDVDATVEAVLSVVLDRLRSRDAPRRVIPTPASLVVRGTTARRPASI